MNKISLCLIAGNVEQYIGRFLNHFQGLADEVIVVIAIGNQTPDKTAEIALGRGCRVNVYYNEGHPAYGASIWDKENIKLQWPHVDDFAAARNMAFDMATGDFVMWADTDDVLDPAFIPIIREAVENLPDDYDGIEMPYQVPEDGLTVFRERIIRKGAARWESPIHEHLVFKPGAKVYRLTAASILHAPTGTRAPNNERNLRILESIPESQRTTSHKFHLFQSLRAVGRIDEAGELCASMLRDPDSHLGQPEKYELFIAAGQLSTDERIRTQMMLQALATDPKRPEAYGELARCEVAAGRDREALAWTTAMREISKTAEKEWNSRIKYHGWLGEFLHAMALRACGRHEEADTTQRNHFIWNGAKISLLHATRGRPAMAAQAQQKWLNRAANPDAIEHIFGLDANDPTACLLGVFQNVVVPGNGGPVEAWNACAAASRGEILVQMSDDWEPPMHWDNLIWDEFARNIPGEEGHTCYAIPGKIPAVIAVSDGHRKDDLLCMAILTRARYKQQGHLFHPEFFSMFSDNWFSRQAFADGVVIDARDRITFEHAHPVHGKGEWDATYQRSNDSYHYKTGEGIYRRLCEGVKVSADIEGWFDFRDVYDHVAKTLPDDGMFVEVGSWKGKSAVYLGQRLQDMGKSNGSTLVAVDTFTGDGDTGEEDVMEAFHGNCEKAQVANPFYRLDSITAARSKFTNQSLDGCFIDASHDYESVKADIAAWLPKVKPGGFFGGHDIDRPGVLQAVTETGFEWEKVGRCWIKKP